MQILKRCASIFNYPCKIISLRFERYRHTKDIWHAPDLIWGGVDREDVPGPGCLHPGAGGPGHYLRHRLRHRVKLETQALLDLSHRERWGLKFGVIVEKVKVWIFVFKDYSFLVKGRRWFTYSAEHLYEWIKHIIIIWKEGRETQWQLHEAAVLPRGCPVHPMRRDKAPSGRHNSRRMNIAVISFNR